MDKFKYYIQQFSHYKIGQFLPPRVTVYWPFILPRKRSKLREVTKIKSAKNGLPMRLFEMAKNDKKLKIALQNRVPRVRVLLPLPKWKHIFWCAFYFAKKKESKATVKKTVRWTVFRESADASFLSYLCATSVVGTFARLIVFCPCQTKHLKKRLRYAVFGCFFFYLIQPNLCKSPRMTVYLWLY